MTTIEKLASIRAALESKLKQPLFSIPVSQEVVDKLSVALEADPLQLGNLTIRKAYRVSDSEIGLVCSGDLIELKLTVE